MDNDAGEDAMDQKILPILRAARARMLHVQEARLMA
jgi:hypothetical protein